METDMPEESEPAADFRTPGWEPDAIDDCTTWTPAMHRQFACGLLDANAAPGGEDGWNGRPGFRLYQGTDPLDADRPDLVDPAPFLAAIAHAILGAQ
jgi:hypothetical protein